MEKHLKEYILRYIVSWASSTWHRSPRMCFQYTISADSAQYFLFPGSFYKAFRPLLTRKMYLCSLYQHRTFGNDLTIVITNLDLLERF